MKNKNIFKITSTAFVGLLILSGVLILGNTGKVEGSVAISNGYTYRNITSANASSTAPVVIKAQGSTILGSVIIASSSPATNLPIRIYDGRTATSTGTLITSIRGGVAEQTITFDVNAIYGIVVDVPAGFNGNYTFTFR